jgi:3-phenylpropionate/trans-cinnamate dioxygenase ferredoxin reductase component
MVIVGAGECGVRAAVALRELGYEGSVTLIGAEEVYPYERPPLSKAGLRAEESPPRTTIVDADALREAEITFLLGVSATSIDRDVNEVVLADGARITYERLLIATGAHARRLPNPGLDAGEIYYLRDHHEASALRPQLRPGATIAIVGGGFIGLEIAAAAASRGCRVIVVELAPQVMSRIVPHEIAAVVAARHEAAGVLLRCGTGVEGMTRQGQAVQLTLTDGSELIADIVVAGIGSAPATELANTAGLAIENGVRVNGRLVTSDPAIYASGDCCSFPHSLFDGARVRLESWRNAQQQGTAAARNMLGADEEYAAVPWFWSDQYELSLQIAGLPTAATIVETRERRDGVVIHFGLHEDGRVVSASAIGEGNAVAKDIRLSEILIAHRVTPTPGLLADPSVNLKALLVSERDGANPAAAVT